VEVFLEIRDALVDLTCCALMVESLEAMPEAMPEARREGSE